MTTQMTEAMKSAKVIQSEMVQWENRLEAIKQEAGNLKRQNEILQGEIDSKRTDYQTYIASTEKQLRDRGAKLFQDQQLLDSQREELKNSLDRHLKDKATLDQERQDFEKEKARVMGRDKMVGEFITSVRRACSVLPD